MTSVHSMRVAAYALFAISATVAGICVYSIAIVRQDFGGAAGTFVIALFVMGTLLPLLVGVGLQGMARQRDGAD